MNDPQTSPESESPVAAAEVQATPASGSSAADGKTDGGPTDGAKTESAEPPAAARVADLEERLRIAEKQVALIRQAHAESAAEFDKVKERLRRNQEQELERARLGMAKNLFAVADNFDRTIDAAQQGTDVAVLLRGVLAVRDTFQKALTGFGLVKYGDAGDRFDPNKHEAIGMVPVAAAALDGAVTVVFEPGYRAGDQVLRPARVQVGKYVAPPEPTPDAAAE